MQPPAPLPNKAESALGLLVRLRWLAVLAQALTFAATAQWLPVAINAPVISTCLAFTALTNLALQTGWRLRLPATRWSAAILLLDTIVLTAMLGAAGGVHNPFTSFYLLHVALSAVFLSHGQTLAVMGLSLAGFGWLYFDVPEWCGAGSINGSIPEHLHLQGMFVALGLTGGSIAYFVGRMQHALRQSEREVEEYRLRFERQQRFASLATLAAGVAHELATPLCTVAIVSKELEKTACTQCLNGACRDDARLIRQEVDRCRTIIDRLADDSGASKGDAIEAASLSALQDDLPAYLDPEHARRVRWNVADGRRVLRAPKISLLQSLASLIKNACEADDSGRPIELNVRIHQNRIEFAVRDRGTGIDELAAARAGEPFFTTKPTGQGMGLGLFIVRMFAERLDGTFELRSHAGAGTEAVLILPQKANDGTG